MGTSHGLELFWEHMVSVFHMVDSHPNLFLYHQVRLQNETDCTESGNISLTRLWKRIEKSVWIGTPKPLMYRRRSCYVGISRFETTLGILRMIMWQVYTQHWDLWSQWASPPVLSMLLWIIKLNDLPIRNTEPQSGLIYYTLFRRSTTMLRLLQAIARCTNLVQKNQFPQLNRHILIFFAIKFIVWSQYVTLHRGWGSSGWIPWIQWKTARTLKNCIPFRALEQPWNTLINTVKTRRIYWLLQTFSLAR